MSSNQTCGRWLISASSLFTVHTSSLLRSAPERASFETQASLCSSVMDWSFVCLRQCYPLLDSVSVSPSLLLHRRCFPKEHKFNTPPLLLPSSSLRRRILPFRKAKRGAVVINCTTSRNAEVESSVDCVGTGQDVECLVPSDSSDSSVSSDDADCFISGKTSLTSVEELLEWGVLISPFFFWGTAMVAMKEVLPKAGPFFVSAFRLIPAGFLLVAFATARGRKPPSGLTAWLSIALFGLVDASCFQGFLAEGLQRTSAGLGSVIIDSQPLTVAILAALLFGESIGVVGAAGLILGVVGLLLLELPAIDFDENSFSLWGSGEWWMLLAAQSMAVGTVMVRWVSKYSDPVMATGWHMVIGGLPLLLISILNQDPAFSGGLSELSVTDISALLYTSIFGSAISYGVYFNSATKGSLTKLSSLTFLTPMFASIFGYLYLNETFSPLQLAGAAVTLVAIYMVNYKKTQK